MRVSVSVGVRVRVRPLLRFRMLTFVALNGLNARSSSCSNSRLRSTSTQCRGRQAPKKRGKGAALESEVGP